MALFSWKDVYIENYDENFISLVDAMLIFLNSKQCLHFCNLPEKRFTSLNSFTFVACDTHLSNIILMAQFFPLLSIFLAS